MPHLSFHMNIKQMLKNNKKKKAANNYSTIIIHYNLQSFSILNIIMSNGKSSFKLWMKHNSKNKKKKKEFFFSNISVNSINVLL